MPTMSREEMERVLQDGGTVLYRGTIRTTAAELPGEAELAQGDPAKEAQARAGLEAQIAALRAELGLLQPVPAATGTGTPSQPEPDAGQSTGSGDSTSGTGSDTGGAATGRGSADDGSSGSDKKTAADAGSGDDSGSDSGSKSRKKG